MTRQARNMFVLAVMVVGGPFLTGCGGADRPIAWRYMLEHSYAARDPQFRRVMDDLLTGHIDDGNAVTTLQNGDAFYPAKLEAIRHAEHTITLETYLYWEGAIGKEFAEALAEQARRGVQVHITIDAIGSDAIDDRYIELLRDAGAHVVLYNPIEQLVLLLTLGDMSERTHRKLMIVDGRIGFIGGAGIADFWVGDANDVNEWRDAFYRVEGPVVAQLQSAFADNWIQSTGQLLDGPTYFPALEPAGKMPAQVLCSSPERGSANMELMYLIAINAATETIDIGTPYFVPDDLLLEMLLKALERGVRVRLVIPGQHIDYEIVKHVSRRSWQPLLEAGLELYEFQPCMYHNKVMVVDGWWTSVGSANLDPLSFRLNDEANLNVFSEAFAQQQTELLEQDIARSNRVTELEHESRSLWKRMMEWLAAPFKPVL